MYLRYVRSYSLCIYVRRILLSPVILVLKVWQDQRNVHFVLMGLVALLRLILLSILPASLAQSLARVRVCVKPVQQVWRVRVQASVKNVRAGLSHWMAILSVSLAPLDGHVPSLLVTEMHLVHL